jgi:hypothetical protein
MVNFLNLETARAPDMNIDFNRVTAPLQNALSGYRDGMNQQYAETQRKEQQTYQRGRDAKEDSHRQMQRAAKMALAVQQMKDDDPAKPAVWSKYLKSYGDGDHSPEELDFRTGPKIAAAMAGEYFDPRDSQMKDAELQYKQAQANRLNREPTGGEAPSNVREYEYFSKLPPDQQQRYLTMKRAEKYLDTGMEFVQPNPAAPGENIRTIQKNPGEVERQKQLGDAQGKKEAAAPSDIAAADNALDLVKSIRNDPNRQSGTGFSSVIQNRVPSTPGYDFQAKVNQARSGAFLTAIQQMRGMGALSNAEGQTATDAVTRMDTALSERAFLEALDDYEAIVSKGRSTAESFSRGPQRMDYNVPDNRGGAGTRPGVNPQIATPQSRGFKYLGPAD